MSTALLVSEILTGGGALGAAITAATLLWIRPRSKSGSRTNISINIDGDTLNVSGVSKKQADELITLFLDQMNDSPKSRDIIDGGDASGK